MTAMPTRLSLTEICKHCAENGIRGERKSVGEKEKGQMVKRSFRQPHTQRCGMGTYFYRAKSFSEVSHDLNALAVTFDRDL